MPTSERDETYASRAEHLGDIGAKHGFAYGNFGSVKVGGEARGPPTTCGSPANEALPVIASEGALFP